jgi:hypothetical protein
MTRSYPWRLDFGVGNRSLAIEYQPKDADQWRGFIWRYDGGLVAGATPCYNPLTATCAPSAITIGGQPGISVLNAISSAPVTADQEFQAGFTCDGMRATPLSPLPSTCLASQFGSSLIRVPPPGAENDDQRPQRIAPRSLFDLSLDSDDLLHGDKYKVSLQLTAINITSNYALYNFLSTLGGTHSVTPRALSAELGFHL